MAQPTVGDVERGFCRSVVAGLAGGHRGEFLILYAPAVADPSMAGFTSERLTVGRLAVLSVGESDVVAEEVPIAPRTIAFVTGPAVAHFRCGLLGVAFSAFGMARKGCVGFLLAPHLVALLAALPGLVDVSRQMLLVVELAHELSLTALPRKSGQGASALFEDI